MLDVDVGNIETTQETSLRAQHQVISIPYTEVMRFSAFAARILMFGTYPSINSVPIHRQSTLSRRLDVSTCEFYGYVDNKGVYNEYTIEMAGWGNQESSGTCAIRIPSFIQTQCNTGLNNFACSQGFDNPRDTQISFRINKAAITQPDCVTEALRQASLTIHDEQNIECICLAECWPSQTTEASPQGNTTIHQAT
ncbi:hypothetical protein GGR51DRAFT_535262 [Nemania sp. FL0031]|nr:hypothetical protein GGR51DRAFT_535262 [Nemania sp. FL0031]